MAWPKIECHFEGIVQTPAVTQVNVAIFRMDDGGIVNGQQQYIRTLLIRKQYPRLDAGWDESRILDYFKARLAEANVQFVINAAPADQICTLKLT